MFMLVCCEISPAIYCVLCWVRPRPGLSLIWAGGRGWPCVQTTGITTIQQTKKAWMMTCKIQNWSQNVSRLLKIEINTNLGISLKPEFPKWAKLPQPDDGDSKVCQVSQEPRFVFISWPRIFISWWVNIFGPWLLFKKSICSQNIWSNGFTSLSS